MKNTFDQTILEVSVEGTPMSRTEYVPISRLAEYLAHLGKHECFEDSIITIKTNPCGKMRQEYIKDDI